MISDFGFRISDFGFRMWGAGLGKADYSDLKDLQN